MGKNKNKIKVVLDDNQPMINHQAKIEEGFKRLKKLQVYLEYYTEGIQLTQLHLAKCKEKTGEILPEDVEYCIKLAARMADYQSK